MKVQFLILLLIICYAQEPELQEEEAIQILKNLKSDTTKILEILDKQWKKYSDKKNEQICVFSDMMQEQIQQCAVRNSENQFIQESLDQSTANIDNSNQKIVKNTNRQKKLQELKCKQNINNIKLLKDQKDINTLSISLQKSFAQSSDTGLIEMIEQNQLYEHTDLSITEEENQFIKNFLGNTNENQLTNDATTELQIAVEIATDSKPLPYSSEKNMEKNKRQIIAVSQEISQSVSGDQEKLTNNQLISNYKVDGFSQQLINENFILQKLINLEQERKVDLQDQLTILIGQNSECEKNTKKMEIIAQLLQQDLDREQKFYASQKEAILQQLDIYTDLLRYYLRQIYKK